jgi:hypothetical protein
MKTDNTLTCTDDLTRLINAHRAAITRQDSLGKILSALSFDICGFRCVIFVVLNTNFKLVGFSYYYINEMRFKLININLI